jgi:hypothetical protein
MGGSLLLPEISVIINYLDLILHGFMLQIIYNTNNVLKNHFSSISIFKKKLRSTLSKGFHSLTKKKEMTRMVNIIRYLIQIFPFS